MKIICNALILYLVAAGLLCSCGADRQIDEEKPRLLLAVASNAGPCFEDLVEAFGSDRAAITISTGSSGSLTRQIREGAPFDIFFSANSVYIDELENESLLLAGSVGDYARGELVVIVSVNSKPLEGDPFAVLRTGEDKTIAIANPGYAPYGMAAKEFLIHDNVWDSIQDRLVIGENISQPLQFVRTGNADFGFTAKSLVVDSDITWYPVPADSYSPIVQSYGVLKHSKSQDAAREFLAFLDTPEAKAIFEKFGYLSPKENSTVSE